MPTITRIAPVLVVSDLDRAAACYRNQLGFIGESRRDPRVLAVHRDQAFDPPRSCR